MDVWQSCMSCRLVLANAQSMLQINAVLLVHLFLRIGMTTEKDVTQAGHGNHKGFQCLHPLRSHGTMVGRRMGPFRKHERSKHFELTWIILQAKIRVQLGCSQYTQKSDAEPNDREGSAVLTEDMSPATAAGTYF